MLTPMSKVGKLLGQSLGATSDPGRSTSRLLFLPNANSGRRFLIDTGAEVSIVPPSPNGRNNKRVYEQLMDLPLRLSAPGPSH